MVLAVRAAGDLPRMVGLQRWQVSDRAGISFCLLWADPS